MAAPHAVPCWDSRCVPPCHRFSLNLELPNLGRPAVSKAQGPRGFCLLSTGITGMFCMFCSAFNTVLELNLGPQAGAAHTLQSSICPVLIFPSQLFHFSPWELCWGRQRSGHSAGQLPPEVSASLLAGLRHTWGWGRVGQGKEM